jgi:hypothetical protein
VTAQACQHHPEEAAVGICVRCSAPLCDACITKLDGINHCRSCLDLLARVSTRVDLRAVLPEAESERTLRARGQARARSDWFALAMGVALLALLAFAMLDAVLPVRAP